MPYLPYKQAMRLGKDNVALSHGKDMSCKACSSSKNGSCIAHKFSKGGPVEGGVHKEIVQGQSQAGYEHRQSHRNVPEYNKNTNRTYARELHQQNLKELKADKTDRRNLAKGGSVCAHCGK